MSFCFMRHCLVVAGKLSSFYALIGLLSYTYYVSSVNWDRISINPFLSPSMAFTFYALI